MRLLFGIMLLSVLALFVPNSTVRAVGFVFLCASAGALLVYFLIKVILRSVRSKIRADRISHRDQTTESPLERTMADALTAAGIAFEREYLVGRSRLDFAFPEKKLAVECDGYRYHSSPAQKEHDRKRDAFLRENGWRVIRFSAQEIKNDPAFCVQKIRDSL